MYTHSLSSLLGEQTSGRESHHRRVLIIIIHNNLLIVVGAKATLDLLPSHTKPTHPPTPNTTHTITIALFVCKKGDIRRSEGRQSTV